MVDTSVFSLTILCLVSTYGLDDASPQTLNGQHPEIEKPEVWGTLAKESIAQKLNLPRIETGARNLILMIGDGMGLSTVTASRILKGQREGLFGEDGKLHMETFPYVGTSKTFCSDTQVADSACSTTAYSCGVKGNTQTIGVTAAVSYQNCTESMNPDNQVSSVLEWAQRYGMSTGIITTSSLTDASPVGSYGHVADRDWENDGEVIDAGYDPLQCLDIGKQLIQESPGKGINVILGGGRLQFLPNTISDPENGKTGYRRDGRNLIDEWINNKWENKSNAKYITNRQELLDIDTDKTDFILGIFSPDDLEYTDKIEEGHDPTLAEMTEIAIKILSRNPNGFYLFVEGGLIDKAHHRNNAQRALIETLEFDKAIQKADGLTHDEDTLIVVSADHSHLLTIGGYSPRGNSIFGFNGEESTGDGLPATTLSYINGPGFRKPTGSGCSRPNITNDPVEDIKYKQMATYYRDSATHGGEDVLIFAKGPFAHLFTGINDQTFIAHAMKFAGQARASASRVIISIGIISVLSVFHYLFSFAALEVS